MQLITSTNQGAVVLASSLNLTNEYCTKLTDYYRKNDRRKLAVTCTALHIAQVTLFGIKEDMQYKETCHHTVRK